MKPQRCRWCGKQTKNGKYADCETRPSIERIYKRAAAIRRMRRVEEPETEERKYNRTPNGRKQ